MADFAWHDLGDGRQVYRRVQDEPVARSHFPAPMVIGDGMDHLQHPADGRHYDSKSRFRRVTKDHGCVEMGNDPARFRPRKQEIDTKANRASLEKARARIARGETPRQA
jgi:hypothetical protein